MRFLLNSALALTFVLVSHRGVALTLSHSGDEVRYEYETDFRSLLPAGSVNVQEAEAAADQHAMHLYGLFHSPEYVEQFGMQPELVEGFAGTKKASIVSAKAFAVPGDDAAWIRYRARSTMLVQKPVLKGWLKGKNEGRVTLPLLADMRAIYEVTSPLEFSNRKWKKCGDPHYPDAIDFYYFYNPYRCEELGSEPLAHDVVFTVEKIARPGQTAVIPLDDLRAANGNGPLVTLYFANGFDSVPEADADRKKIERDAGFRTYSATIKHLQEHYEFEIIESKDHLRRVLKDDFDQLHLLTEVSLDFDRQRRYITTLVKVDEKRTWVARVALFDAGNEGRLKSFPKFWKEAWENADFLYFGGHSGDGQSLSLAPMLKTLEKSELDGIEFQKKKTQIVLIDACSSYAHFQEQYAKRKPHGLHLVTYGLVSLFHLANNTIDSTLAILFSEKEMNWDEGLASIEKAQLRGHVEANYRPEYVERTLRDFERAKAYPNYLLNVNLNP